MKTWTKYFSLVACASVVCQALSVSAQAGERMDSALPPLLAGVDSVPLTDEEASVIRGEAIPVAAIAVIVARNLAGRYATSLVMKRVALATPAIIKFAKAYRLARTAKQVRGAIKILNYGIELDGYKADADDAVKIYRLIRDK